ncbi:MAG: AMP-dependent synthetase [Blastopirellula sp.]|nr:MAG: AMP-dependent synthetase [Blastopirellula sp.]
MINPAHADAVTGLPSRIHKALEEGALPGRNRIAFVDENNKKWSYSDLKEAVQHASEKLKEIGVSPGDRVMLVCENSIAAITLIFAASNLDAITAVINARQSAREIDAICEDCSPRRVIYTDTVSQNAREHAERHGAEKQNFGSIGELMVGVLNEESLPMETFEDPAKQVAILIYTTGTTGRPKGVMLSHRNLMFNGVRAKRIGTSGPADIGLCLMPVAHSYGFTGMLGAVYAGTRLIIMPRFDLEKAIDLITSGTLTTFQAVPALYARIIDTCGKGGLTLTPNSIRFLIVGTAPLDITLRRSVEKLFGNVLCNGYGLTETAPTISRSSYEIGSDEVNLGAPVAGVEIKIVDENGKEVPKGDLGELWVRGPNVMVGYFGNPEATAAIFDEDGYMNTGDVVRQNEKGALSIEGRTKELIIKSGFNVYPVEVEAQLNSHPDVLNSAVVGCEQAGDETVVAFVEGTPGAKIDPKDVKNFVRGTLAAYKVPSHIFVVETLPYSPNAKILKKQLKDRAKQLIEDM